MKSQHNAFTERKESAFNTPTERAKATIAATKAAALTPPKGGHSVNGLKNLSKRGQRLTQPAKNGISVRPKSTGEIPQALRSTKG